MQIEGKIESISRDIRTGKNKITILTDYNILVPELQELSLCDFLTITIDRYVVKRSLNANALFWKCVGDLAKAMKTSKWDVYMKLLRDNGNFDYINVRPDAVNHTRRQWRESEVVGDITLEGEKFIQLKCYYGSSTFDVSEFQCLLELTFSEMEQLGLVTPSQERLERSLKLWESQHIQY